MPGRLVPTEEQGTAAGVPPGLPVHWEGFTQDAWNSASPPGSEPTAGRIKVFSDGSAWEEIGDRSVSRCSSQPGTYGNIDDNIARWRRNNNLKGISQYQAWEYHLDTSEGMSADQAWTEWRDRTR